MKKRKAKRIAVAIVSQLLTKAITSNVALDYLNEDAWAAEGPDLQNALKELADELADQVAGDYGYIVIDLHDRD